MSDTRWVGVSTWLHEQPSDRVAAWMSKVSSPEGRKRYSRALEYAQHGGEDDLWFGTWLALVDTLVVRRVGLSVFDLADCTFADWFEAGYSPRDAAREALESDDTYAAIMGGDE